MDLHRTENSQRQIGRRPWYRITIIMLIAACWAGGPAQAQQQCAAPRSICQDPGVCFVTQAAKDSWAATNNCTFITLEMMRAVNPTGSDSDHAQILGYLNKFARQYEVNTPARMAHFLSQVAHESGFKTKQENLKYSPTRMRQIFGCKGGSKNYVKATDDCKNGRLRPKLWTQEADYANNPENLGNYAYADRMENGNEASGDGYKYRGRGIIQLTGREKYKAFQEHHNKLNPSDPRSFVDNPELIVDTIEFGVESAFFFWHSKGVNSKSDSGSVCAVTNAVNGGSNGYADRKERFNDVGCLLGVPEETGGCS